MVAVSSEHRHDAISAVTYVIDSIKASTTIWKKVCLYSICVCSTNLIVTLGNFTYNV